MGKRVGVLTGLLVLALGSGAVAQSPSAHLEPQRMRVEVPEAGVAFSHPPDWHSVQLTDEFNSVRLVSPDGWVSCDLADLTPDTFATLDAIESEWIPTLWYAQPDFPGEYTVSRLVLPVGVVLVVTREEETEDIDFHNLDFYVPTPQHFTLLGCSWLSPYGDAFAADLVSIAETFEFLPAEE